MDTGNSHFPTHSDIRSLGDHEYDFTPQGFRARKAHLREAVAANDLFSADILERSMYMEVLQAIAEGHPNPQELAKQAIEVSKGVDFDRLFLLLGNLNPFRKEIIRKFLGIAPF